MKNTFICFMLCVIFSATHICKGDSILQSILTQASDATLSEDGILNFTQLVVKYGKSVEQYDIVTEDGYILTLFHIRGDSKPPVLFLHGLADSCDTFVVNGHGSLGITLATAGYDVWVGNNRGNLYGRRHVTLNPDTDKKFWDYSLHEIGYYDLAAMIDFVCKTTGYESIATVGHSQGTSAHFALTSLRPEYNAKIKVFIALAPVAFLNDLPQPLGLIAAAGPAIFPIVKTAGIEELYQNHKAISNLTTFLCSKGLVSYLVCALGVIFPLAGFDTKGIDKDFLTGVLVGHYPRGVSRKCLEHNDQIVLRRSFAQYDYGAGNIAVYGRLSPPDYDLTAVTTKVALFVSRNDPLATIQNVEHLRNILPNVVHYEVMEPQEWNHLDFVVRKDMNKYLFPSILNVLKLYNN